MLDRLDRLPKSIRVGPYDIRVEIVDEDALKGDWGQYDPNKLLISLERGVPCKWRAIDTVMHEIHHVIWGACGFGRSATEEMATRGTATGWTQVYRDNPELLAWIVAVANE